MPARSLLFLLAFCLMSLQMNGQTSGKLASDSTSKNLDEYNFLKNLHIRFDTISVASKQALLEQMSKFEVISGWIFFTGTNFPSTVSVLFSGSGSGILRGNLDKLVAGSRVTFEKFTIKKPDGTTFVMNKHLVFR